MQKTSLERTLIELKEREKYLYILAEKMLSADDGNVFPIDLFTIGAMKRTSSNLNGFLSLVKAKNMQSSNSLLRIQLDTFIRFHALAISKDSNKFVNDILDGRHIRNIKDKDGNKMTDGYLVDLLSSKYPWLKDVYKNLSGYIHFSGNHLFGSVENIHDDKKCLTFVISKEDEQYPEESWIEIVECFNQSLDILFQYINSWIVVKVETSNE
jgi:hypothetical protein